MHAFYETNDEFLQLTPQQIEELQGGDTWCGPQEIDQKTGWTAPELRIIDETGAVMSLCFH